MTTRREFLFGGAAILTLGIGGVAIGGWVVPDLRSNADQSQNIERARKSIESAVGHRFDTEQLVPFVDYLDSEYAWIWGEQVSDEVVDRTICTQFIMTSSLAVNGVDVSDYQFFGDELICSPFARLD
ncbi:MAG: hypothetical protein ACI8Y4_002938 [Candidatus Poriferisodalaceae bacterium]|jgi:hypothetical protein